MAEHKTYQIPVEGIEIETRGRQAGEQKMIRGLATPFDEVTELIPGVLSEVFRRGAFEETLKLEQRERPLVALWAHDQGAILGSVSNGTLRLEERANGLAFEIEPNLDTPWGQGAVAAIERGDARSASIGFLPTDGGVEWHDRPDGSMLREIRAAELVEVSVLPLGQYSGAVSDYRSAVSGDLEDLLKRQQEQQRQIAAATARAQRDNLRRRLRAAALRA